MAPKSIRQMKKNDTMIEEENEEDTDDVFTQFSNNSVGNETSIEKLTNMIFAEAKTRASNIKDKSLIAQLNGCIEKNQLDIFRVGKVIDQHQNTHTNDFTSAIDAFVSKNWHTITRGKYTVECYRQQNYTILNIGQIVMSQISQRRIEYSLTKAKAKQDPATLDLIDVFFNPAMMGQHFVPFSDDPSFSAGRFISIDRMVLPGKCDKPLIQIKSLLFQTLIQICEPIDAIQAYTFRKGRGIKISDFNGCEEESAAASRTTKRKNTKFKELPTPILEFLQDIVLDAFGLNHPIFSVDYGYPDDLETNEIFISLGYSDEERRRKLNISRTNRRNLVLEAIPAKLVEVMPEIRTSTVSADYDGSIRWLKRDRSGYSNTNDDVDSTAPTAKQSKKSGETDNKSGVQNN